MPQPVPAIRADYLTASRIHIDHHGRARAELRFERAGGKGPARCSAAWRLADVYGVDAAYRYHSRHYAPGSLSDPGPQRDPLTLRLAGTPESVARYLAALPRVLARLEALATKAARAFGRWSRSAAAAAHTEYEDAASLRARARAFRADAFAALLPALLDHPGALATVQPERPLWEQGRAVGEQLATELWFDAAAEFSPEEAAALLEAADRTVDPAALAHEREQAALYTAQTRREAALYAALDGEDLPTEPEPDQAQHTVPAPAVLPDEAAVAQTRGTGGHRHRASARIDRGDRCLYQFPRRRPVRPGPAHTTQRKESHGHHSPASRRPAAARTAHRHRTDLLPLPRRAGLAQVPDLDHRRRHRPVGRQRAARRRGQVRHQRR